MATNICCSHAEDFVRHTEFWTVIKQAIFTFMMWFLTADLVVQCRAGPDLPGALSTILTRGPTWPEMHVPWMEFGAVRAVLRHIPKTYQVVWLPHLFPSMVFVLSWYKYKGVHKRPWLVINNLSSIVVQVRCPDVSGVKVITSVWLSTQTGFRDTISRLACC